MACPFVILKPVRAAAGYAYRNWAGVLVRLQPSQLFTTESGAPHSCRLRPVSAVLAAGGRGVNLALMAPAYALRNGTQGIADQPAWGKGCLRSASSRGQQPSAPRDSALNFTAL